MLHQIPCFVAVEVQKGNLLGCDYYLRHYWFSAGNDIHCCFPCVKVSDDAQDTWNRVEDPDK